MLFYIARRLVWTMVVLLVVLFITFAVFFLMPNGDPALRFAGKSPTTENIALIRHNLHLDKPWYEEFGLFVKTFVTGERTAGPGSATRTGTSSRSRPRSRRGRRGRSS